jgi:hypothetical protein
MKLFTVDEANEALPVIIPKLVKIREIYAKLGVMRDGARAAAAASQFGGGMEGGTSYVNMLYLADKLTAEIREIGAEIKDQEAGLIDFPSIRHDRVVLLCWKLDELPEIQWWHEADAGFAGRQRI